MKFLVSFDVVPDEYDEARQHHGEPITPEQMLEHMRTYMFAELVSWEMSLLKDDPDHEGSAENYRSVLFENVTVQFSDDTVMLAAILQRILTDEDYGYISLPSQGLMLDGWVDLSPDEHALVERILKEVHDGGTEQGRD